MLIHEDMVRVDENTFTVCLKYANDFAKNHTFTVKLLDNIWHERRGTCLKCGYDQCDHKDRFVKMYDGDYLFNIVASYSELVKMETTPAILRLFLIKECFAGAEMIQDVILYTQIIFCNICF